MAEGEDPWGPEGSQAYEEEDEKEDEEMGIGIPLRSEPARETKRVVLTPSDSRSCRFKQWCTDEKCYFTHPRIRDIGKAQERLDLLLEQDLQVNERKVVQAAMNRMNPKSKAPMLHSECEMCMRFGRQHPNRTWSGRRIHRDWLTRCKFCPQYESYDWPNYLCPICAENHGGTCFRCWSTQVDGTASIPDPVASCRNNYGPWNPKYAAAHGCSKGGKSKGKGDFGKGNRPRSENPMRESRHVPRSRSPRARKDDAVLTRPDMAAIRNERAARESRDDPRSMRAESSCRPRVRHQGNSNPHHVRTLSAPSDIASPGIPRNFAEEARLFILDFAKQDMKAHERR